jgi:hypothetical protein
MAQSHFNLISGLTSHDPQVIIPDLLSRNSSFKQVLDAVLACLSQKPVQELLTLVKSSTLFSILKTLDDLIKSQVIAEMDVKQMLREMFSNFSNSREGMQHLIAVIALLVLVQIPTNDVSVPDDEHIEALKLLFRSTLFNDDIVIFFMGFRDEQQQHRDRCPCVNCNARFIFSIGWYVAAQEAHNRNAFVENSNFLVVA